MGSLTRVFQNVFRILGVLVWAWWGIGLAACSADDAGPSDTLATQRCQYTWECNTGLVCDTGRCVEPSKAPGPDDPTPPVDPPDEPKEPDDPNNPTNPDDDDAPPVDAVEKPVIGEAHYRTCKQDGDCAVFSGNCITEVYLSRPDLDGRTKVSLHELAPDLIAQGEGVCTDTCTNDPRVCDNLVASNSRGDSAPYTCQLIYAGLNPYDLAVQGATPLDEVAMARGVAYASICRPPFDYAAAHSDSFCEACTQDDDCSEDARCMLESPHAQRPAGSCVDPCTDASECPVGFACTHLDADDTQTYCMPIENTCGRCLDQDGDGRGVGRCGPLDDPYTGVDCDDADADRFYDANNPRHAFPTYCGAALDMNCNLIDDETEQLGSDAHCGGCGDSCGSLKGALENGRWSCDNIVKDAAAEPEYACKARCADRYDDCDSEPGCETFLSDEHRWYEDADGDGYGDTATKKYRCPEKEPELGWSQKGGDCDDDDNTVYPGAPELCDGKDNDCNGEVDDNINDPEVGKPCLITELEGVCAEGTKICGEVADEQGDTSIQRICQSNVLSIADQKNADELCNCKDDNCNGLIDENVAAMGSCTVPGAVGVCAAGEWRCGDCVDTLDSNGDQILDVYGNPIQEATSVCTSTTVSSDDEIGDGIDSNCDGIDGNLSNMVFVAPISIPAPDGSSEKPFSSIDQALVKACAEDGCKDIIVAQGEFTSDESLKIPVFSDATNNATPYYDAENNWVDGEHAKVRIYGGYTVSYDDCTYETCKPVWTSSENGRSIITRVTPATTDGEFGEYFAVIEPEKETSKMSLSLNRIELKIDNRTSTPSRSEERKIWHAPSLVGIRCPATGGCALLSFTYANINIPRANDGNEFTPQNKLAVMDDFKEASLGCTIDLNCAEGNDGRLSYKTRADGEADNFGGQNHVCGDAEDSEVNGGNSGAWRYNSPGDWQYIQMANNVRFSTSDENAGFFYCNKSDEKQPCGSKNTYIQIMPKNGEDGEQGANSSYNTVSRVIAEDKIGRSSLGETAATEGTNGRGGGGGAGCNKSNDDSWDCRNANGVQFRGGGGGAGGCGGTDVGYAGGFGGSVFGLVMFSDPNAPTRIETHPLTVRQQAFSITLGAAGNGGIGEGGQNGQNGREGKNVEGLPTSNPAYAYGRGGDGGNGGGAGAGAGGYAGDSIGIAIKYTDTCDESEGRACAPSMPAHMKQNVAQYISLNSPAKGGEGGVPGCNDNADVCPEPAARGEDGISEHIYTY